MNEKILLHTCCGPCTTYPIKYFKEKGFEVLGFFYNPNIFPFSEKESRLQNAKKLSLKLIAKNDDYDFFLEKIKGKEANKDGKRCDECYRIRLERTALEAVRQKIKTISTTLLISPYQDQVKLKAIGEEVSKKHGLVFYYKDFRPFFKQSREMSKDLDLYRQNYCGCSFSKKLK